MEELNQMEIKVDFCGSLIDGMIVKTKEVNNRNGDAFYRVDYICPVRNKWQFGMQYAGKTLIGIIEAGKHPVIA